MRLSTERPSMRTALMEILQEREIQYWIGGFLLVVFAMAILSLLGVRF